MAPISLLALSASSAPSFLPYSATAFMGKVLGGSVTLVDDKTPYLLLGPSKLSPVSFPSEIIEVERMKGPNMQFGKHLYNMFTVTFQTWTTLSRRTPGRPT